MAKKRGKRGFFKWMFKNPWYYALPALWIIGTLFAVMLFTGDIQSLLPAGTDMEFFNVLFFTIVPIYLSWIIPFAIYWAINKK